jgi:hypothetical protein
MIPAIIAFVFAALCMLLSGEWLLLSALPGPRTRAALLRPRTRVLPQLLDYLAFTRNPHRPCSKSRRFLCWSRTADALTSCLRSSSLMMESLMPVPSICKKVKLMGSPNQSMTPSRLVNWQMTVSSLPDSALRVSRESDEAKLTSKGFHHRCFPQFIGDSEIPDTLEGCLATCNKQKAILATPANNRFNTSYRVLADNNLTQNPRRHADFVLIATTVPFCTLSITRMTWNRERLFTRCFLNWQASISPPIPLIWTKPFWNLVTQPVTLLKQQTRTVTMLLPISTSFFLCS